MSDQLLHSGCLRQARQTPSAIAVICGDKKVSYGELVGRASRVAAQLKANGVRPEVVVGVLADRSIEAVIGILAVELSGGAYLPLDPHQPIDRLQLVLEDANVSTVLCGPRLESRIKSNSLVTMSIDAILRNGSLPEDFECGANNPNDLAYIIFTSGSTGRPKGVMIEHRSAINTILDVNDRFGVGPGDCVLCLSSFGFDLSVYDLFGLWTAGGTVVIPTPAEVSNPSAWLRLVQKHSVTIWNSVPQLLDLLVSHVGERRPSAAATLDSLRLALLSGDWIPVTLPDRFRRLQSKCEIVSLGGATEASIWSVIYPIQNVETTWMSIPYGKAMRNQAMYVLDENLKECGPGIDGEIYIGGTGVARGYVGRADLTEQQFLFDRFAPGDKTRLYKTGDLGRLWPDGNIEILGRADFQVKINGHRIELGEIEVALKRHPGVREAIAVSTIGAGNHKRLIAFVITDGRSISQADLRDCASRQLPAYMLPAQIFFVTSLPLTPTGKVDRKRLLDDAKHGQNDSHTRNAGDGRKEQFAGGSHSSVDSELREIWEVVFERDGIGPDDNFFELGGDSLVAIALSARLQRQFGHNVTMADVIAFPTIRELGMFLEHGGARDLEDGSVEINRGHSGPPIFFVPPILGDLFGMRELALRLPPELQIIGLQPRGILRGESPNRSIAAIASHYLKQVRRRQPQGLHHLVGFSLGGTIAFEMAKMLVEAGEEPPVLIMIDAPRHGRNRIVRAGLRVSNFLSRSMLRQRRHDDAPEIPCSHAEVYEAHHLALCQYRPRSYAAKAHWLRTSQRPSMIKRLVDDFLGTWDWSIVLPHSPAPDWIPGNHYNLFEHPYVDGLAARLREILQSKPSLRHVLE